MHTTTPGGAEMLASVRAIREQVEEAAPRAEAERQLPPDLVEVLRGSGVFGMPVPSGWGGPDLPVPDQLAVLEELSYADGAAGWCAMIGCDGGYYSYFLDESVARTIWDDVDLITAGQNAPMGKAFRDGDGWSLSGRWSFGSGATHADRIVGGAWLLNQDGTPAEPDGSGVPAWRTFVLPREKVEIHDTWNTTGLLGSGSHDYSTKRAFVPDEHSFEPLEAPRWGGPTHALPWWYTVKIAAVPLGLARRAIDEVVMVAPSKLLLPEFVILTDSPQARADLARAHALLGSARAWVTEVVGDAWATCEHGDALRQEQTVDLRLCMSHAVEASRQAIRLCFDTAGTSAVRRGSALERAYRDVATLAQHVIVNPRLWGQAGQVLFGQPPSVPML